jgi:Cof subfamily protein (haloacid dehalogenase superfamily)
VIRAVVTDLDGTVVRDDGTVSPRMLDAARRLDAKGIPLVAATARTPAGLRALEDLDGLFALAVCSTGAIGWAAGELLWQQRFAEHEVRAVVEAAYRIPGAGVGAYDGERWLMTEAYAAHRGWQSRGPRSIVEIEQVLLSTGMSMAVCVPGMTPFAVIEMLMAYGIGTQTANLTTAGRNVVDITPPGVDKASGVAQALAHIGVDPAEAVAFGDMPADIPMLRLVGCGVAVGEGHPDVVAAADHVTLDVHADGVPVMLEVLGVI